MKKYTLIKPFILLLLVGLLLIVTGCGSNETKKSKDGEVEIKFPTFKAGENVGAELFLGQVERFNEEYKGEYKIVVEESPQSAYADKIQQLAQQDKLPVIVHGTGSGGLSRQWFEDVIIKNDLYYDLSTWLEENQEINDRMIEESIEFNTTDDGALVSLPMWIVRSPFIYYNEKMYESGQEIRDLSWEEYIDSLGDNKIAFQTGENAWTTGLFWSALIADEPNGVEFLQGFNNGELTNLNEPIIIKSIERLLALIEDHGSSNSVGAIYADAANAFMSENAAFIANGPWMTSEFDEESSDKWSNDFDGNEIRADYFPGNIGLTSFDVGGDWISNSASDEEKEAALAWFSFLLSPEEIETAMLIEGGQTPNFETSQEYKEKLKDSIILSNIEEATTEEIIFVPNILDLLPSSVAENELAKFLPELINGKLTPDEFASELTKKAE